MSKRSLAAKMRAKKKQERSLQRKNYLARLDSSTAKRVSVGPTVVARASLQSTFTPQVEAEANRLFTKHQRDALHVTDIIACHRPVDSKSRRFYRQVWDCISATYYERLNSTR